MRIRCIKLEDSGIWSRMRTQLWPSTNDEHREEIERFFSGLLGDVKEVFLAETSQGDVIGFIELNVRNYAEGSQNSQVPYVEGWFVERAHRRKGVGKALIKRAEQWAIDEGFNELASDSEIDNTQSVAAHKKLGFQEVERIVCFLKPLA